MSTALASITQKDARSNQCQAAIGASLAYNEILLVALPPIVAELEKKIAELERRLNRYEGIEIAEALRIPDDPSCNLCSGVGTGCRVCMGRN